MLNMMPRATNSTARHAGQLQLLDPEEHRQPEDEQHRPDGLAADAERQLLLHVQGLVAGSARRAITAGPRTGGGSSRTTRTPTGASPATTRRSCGRTWCWTPTSGSRQQTEAVLSAERGRLGPDQPRRTSASRSPQFHPELNPRNVIAEGQLQRPELAELQLRQPPVRQGRGLAVVGTDQRDLHRGRHAIKTGIYFEKSRNSEGKGGVGAGPWAGEYNFTVDTANPLDTNYGFANALVGNFTKYTETDAFSDVKGNRPTVRVLCAGHVEGQPALTVDYGVRFLWFRPWRLGRSPRRVLVPSVTSRRRRRCSISRCA